MAIIEYRITATHKRRAEPVVLVEFTRDDLEKLISLYAEADRFTYEVREAMRFLDGLDTDLKGNKP